MRKILIVGNPNVGKSTLFNSLTKSNEHTGNFHGVTVEEKHKIIELENEKFDIVDLPGMYSLNSFSYEEEVARNELFSANAEVVVLCDANCLRKNLYLCLQLQELGFDYNILINNCDYFIKNKNKLNLNILKNKLNKNVQIINAKKITINSIKTLINSKKDKFNKNDLNYLNKYINIVKNKFNIDEKLIIFALNGKFENLDKKQIEFIKTLYPEIIKDRYNYIDEILKDAITVNDNFNYGLSKLDKILLNPCVAILGFTCLFLLNIYLIFFLVGPFFSDQLYFVFEHVIINPFMNFLYSITDNIWLLEFFRSGVFNSLSTVLGFLPQICLLFLFLTVLEDSGIISRMAYVLDDLLCKFGLNGKTVYTMLLGFGCNTMSTMACRNLNEKNLKIKTALLNPYLSCIARLPVYVVIASAFFNKFSFFVVAGLYLLGIVVALIVALILNKTILKTKQAGLLLEFPPMRGIDFKHILQAVKVNAVDFFKRVFTVILSVGIIVWIVSHTMFNLQYTQDISQSILFFVADKISFIFAPIGLNSSGVICALIVGVLAKELIVSTMSICNNVQTEAELSKSLLMASSVVNLTMPSAVSFLIFSLLYCPCISNLAVLKKETDKFYMWFAVISQFTIAYMLSFVVYQSLTKGWLFAMLMTFVIAIIMFVIIFIIKKVKHGKCLTCGKCK